MVVIHHQVAPVDTILYRHRLNIMYVYMHEMYHCNIQINSGNFCTHSANNAPIC